MPAAKGGVPWNAGTSKGWTDKRGYRWLYVNDNGRRVARREHRVLMEINLGRKLEPWELVHHKDGNPQNNAIENLELVEWGAHTTEHHKGSRKSEDARRSMEAFALMREELRRERALRAELLDALQLFARYEHEMETDDHVAGMLTYAQLREAASAAIAKATGGAQ
jgi:hypothetical protein